MAPAGRTQLGFGLAGPGAGVQPFESIQRGPQVLTGRCPPAGPVQAAPVRQPRASPLERHGPPVVERERAREGRVEVLVEQTPAARRRGGSHRACAADRLAFEPGQHVYVIGAGNSAGQAAIHLSKYAASVTMVVRGPGLTASMSSYLVTEISKTANIRVRPSTEVTGGDGQCSLETLTLRHRISGATEAVPAAALFVMIGAEPRTSWLPGSIERDDEGFIRTGRASCRPAGR